MTQPHTVHRNVGAIHASLLLNAYWIYQATYEQKIIIIIVNPSVSSFNTQ